MIKILKDLGTRKCDKGYSRRWVLVECSCGRQYETVKYSLKLDRHCKECKSNAHKTHGENRTRLHVIWAGMKTRCRNKNSKDYKYYGAKGVNVCSEWDKYITFAEWARENGYTDELTIDRIDSLKDYEPSNCRWITHSENSSRK